MIKKIITIFFVFGSVVLANSASAQTVTAPLESSGPVASAPAASVESSGVSSGTDFKSVFGTITPPAPIAGIEGVTGEDKITTLLSRIVLLIYIVSAIVFVFMLLFSAFQWIISGGEKEAVASARNRMQWAIIGIVVLALVFVILRVLGTLTGFQFFGAPSSASLTPQERQELQEFEDIEKARELESGGQ